MQCPSDNTGIAVNAGEAQYYFASIYTLYYLNVKTKKKFREHLIWYQHAGVPKMFFTLILTPDDKMFLTDIFKTF